VLEEKIEKRFCDLAKMHGAKCLKLSIISRRGYPDRVLLYPGGRVEFVELKRPGKKPRKLQEKRLRELRDLGFTAEYLDTLELVEAWFDQ